MCVWVGSVCVCVSGGVLALCVCVYVCLCVCVYTCVLCIVATTTPSSQGKVHLVFIYRITAGTRKKKSLVPVGCQLRSWVGRELILLLYFIFPVAASDR